MGEAARLDPDPGEVGVKVLSSRWIPELPVGDEASQRAITDAQVPRGLRLAQRLVVLGCQGSPWLQASVDEALQRVVAVPGGEDPLGDPLVGLVLRRAQNDALTNDRQPSVKEVEGAGHPTPTVQSPSHHGRSRRGPR